MIEQLKQMCPFELGKYTVLDVAIDGEGLPWFLIENYYEGQNWWHHLSDEYGGEREQP